MTESLVHLQVYVVLQKDTITIELNQINYSENEKRYETLHQNNPKKDLDKMKKPSEKSKISFVSAKEALQHMQQAFSYFSLICSQ